MLLYVQSKAFPHRTFVVRVQPYETIARVRAQLLHILYELGRGGHQFRLRYKGQYLRDAYSVEDYNITDNAVIKMVPLSNRMDSCVDLRSIDGSTTSSEGVDLAGYNQDIKNALQKEIRVFTHREKLIFHFNGLLYVHFLGIFFAFLSTYWYSGFWTTLLWIIGTHYCPNFNRFSGFVGKQSIYKDFFCICYGTLSLLAMGAASILGTMEWVRFIHADCLGLTVSGDCSHQTIYSAIFYSIQAICLFVCSVIVWVLYRNMKIEYGDYVERHLVQNRDIEEVMGSAKKGSVKEKRLAAFELATLAAMSDDNKFRIVAEGGLEVLMRLSLSRDTSTQEHAVEAIAELLTVPSIQDTYVEMGGAKMLCALLRAESPRLVHECATAICYIVSDSEENHHAIVMDHGLEDLAYAAQHGSILTQRTVAGVFLELAFNSEVRSHMASLNTPARALLSLCRSNDADTQRFALQTLELLAIESSDMICAQEELVELLLELPSRSVDKKVYVLSAKILLYFAQNLQTLDNLLDSHHLHRALTKYAQTKDIILQKVVVKVIFCCLEMPQHKYRAQHLELDQLLQYIKDNAADRESWDMADHALQLFHSDEDLPGLPTLSTREKLARMGSQVSLTSHVSMRSHDHKAITESLTDFKKSIS